MDRFLRAIGIAQGAYFLWVTLGLGAVLTGVVTAILVASSGWPLWSIALIGAGLFLLAVGVLNAVVVGVANRIVPRSEPYHALSRVIEDGRRLRQRLSTLDADPPENQEMQRWKFRIEEWVRDADETVERVAPFRTAAFRVDTLIVGYPGELHGRPKQVSVWEYDVEAVLEKLLYIRVTL